MAIIEVKNLSKKFRVKVKEKGLKERQSRILVLK